MTHMTYRRIFRDRKTIKKYDFVIVIANLEDPYVDTRLVGGFARPFTERSEVIVVGT